MSLNDNITKTYTDVLLEELLPAMGCTEPISIAYAASIVTEVLGGEPTLIKAGFSGNIIKNVKSVIVPATGGLRGLKVAVAAGVTANAPEKKLEVLSGITPQQSKHIKEYSESGKIEVYKIENSPAFQIDIRAERNEHTAHVRILNGHTEVVSVECDGKNFTDKYKSDYVEDTDTFKKKADRSLLNVEDIVTFSDTVCLDELRPYLENQIEMNMSIAEEGLKGNWGACIGKLLYNNGNCELRNKARAYAAAASDARMSGCELPVCIVSGSGNQGITSSVPVVVYANAMGADEETTLRAVLLSDLITVHQKTGIGKLSAYCGAISAGCGAGAGICYLYGGRFVEVAHTLVNAVAILSGTICDGAKPSCAAKIAMAVEAGIMGYEMYKSGHQFFGGDGIVSKGVENTIKNVGRLAREGMKSTDEEIIDIMLQ